MLDDVDARLLSDYAAELGRGRPRRLAPATIARRLAAARSLIRFALGAERVPDVALSPRRPRRLPQAPKLSELERTLAAPRRRRAATAPQPRTRRARLFGRPAQPRGRRARPRGRRLRRRDDPRPRQRREGTRRPARRGGRLPGRRSTSATAGSKLVAGAENALFLSARGRRLDTSTLRQLVPAPAQPPPCVRDAPARGRRRPARDPGAARSQPRSRRRRSTATSTAGTCAASTTGRIRDPDITEPDAPGVAPLLFSGRRASRSRAGSRPGSRCRESSTQRATCRVARSARTRRSSPSGRASNLGA